MMFAGMCSPSGVNVTAIAIIKQAQECCNEAWNTWIILICFVNQNNFPDNTLSSY
jgi:hypothetical protein